MSNRSCDARLKLVYAILVNGFPRGNNEAEHAWFYLCETSFIWWHGTLLHIQLYHHPYNHIL
jgi:hypothetical protein